MASKITKISDIINPQVMADMISAKIQKKIVVTPFAKVDTKLQGVPGDTITIPKYAYIGDAGEIAEGESIETAKLTASTTTAKVKKAMKAVSITDEAILSGYGNPVGEANNQLASSIAAKIDEDAMTALQTATLAKDSTGIISYSGIVDAIDVFEEELNTEKVIFVHPRQVTQLRKDTNFISADKYTGEVIMTGEIGKIANCRVVPSRKVSHVDGVAGSRTVTIGGTVAAGDKYTIDGYTFTVGETHTATAAAAGLVELITADTSCKYSASNSSGVITLTEKSGYYGVGLYIAPTISKTSDAGTITAGGTYSGTAFYKCPIVKLTQDGETEDEAAALTVYLKRDTNIETERHTLSRTTDISVDKFYTVVLSNASKVVLAKFAASASV